LSDQKKKKFNVLLFILKFFAFLTAAICVIVPVSIGTLMYLNAPYRQVRISETEGITVQDDGSYFVWVRRGETSQSVGSRLKQAGLIKSRLFWNLLCRREEGLIKAGTFRVEMPKTQLSILKELIQGEPIIKRITIPEGVTLRRAARILENAGICKIEDFIEAAGNPGIVDHYNIPNRTMEGYLFPDTYLFPVNYQPEEIVREMADNFFKRIAAVNPGALDMSPQELNEKVIIASIIEREYILPSEAPLMAGVFFNRLRVRMALQSCATVEYIITEIQGKPHPTRLFYRDLEIENPYNTYIRPGLPPGPVSSPGTVALRAAMFPQATDFFYFRLVDPSSGIHYFSRTLDDHNRAEWLYLKGL